MSSFPQHLSVPDSKTSPKKERRSGLSRLISPRRSRRRSNSTSTPSTIPKKTEKEQLRLNVARSPKFRVDRTLVDYDLLEPTSSEPLALSPRPRLPPRRIGISDPSLAPHAPNGRGRNRRRTIGSKNEGVQPLQHELSVQLNSFRPGFPAADRDRELFPDEIERVRNELDQVEQFLFLLPTMVESEEGRRQFPYVEQQTETNIQEVLELVLTESNSEALVEELVLLNQQMSDIRARYEELRTSCGMDSMNSEENAARLLATQLSIVQLRELLDQAAVSHDKRAAKSELEELVVVHQLLQRVDPGSHSDEDEFSEDFGERESCIICLDDYQPKHFYALSCGHSYCKYCHKGYIESKINDGDVLDMMCPHPDCDEPFTPNDIANLVPVSMANRYDQLKVLGELNKNPNCRWCPSPGCNTAMIGDPSQETLTCTQCGQGICFLCKQVEHEGRTCEEYAEYRRNNDDDEGRWIEWARNNNAKQCPKCGVWIIRPTGCNQVICKSCQWSFCWLCMKECIVPDHYKYGECEGKWFEDTNLTTSQKIMAGIIFGGVIVLASPILALAGTIALGRRLKRKVRRKKQSLSDTDDSSDLDWN